jgi:hypothetical protein
MKKLIVAGVLGLASPAWAHGGAHVHPHGAEGWLMVVAALVVIAGAVSIARGRR